MAIGIVKGLAAADDAPPIGFVWKSASPISPAAIFAGTTWSQLKDRAIIAAGGGYANGSTGGRASVTLTTKEMPSHNLGGRTYAYRYSHYSEYIQCWRNALYRYSCRQHHENNVQRWCA